MEKIRNLLERHIQWIAVGLGGLYMVWMAWAYVIGSPVQTEINGSKLGPGDVDKQIVDFPLTALERQMKRTDVVSLPKPQWVKSVSDTMAFYDLKPVQFTGVFVRFNPLPQLPGTPGASAKAAAEIAQPIEKLPVIPPAILGEVLSGASNVVPAGTLASMPQPPTPADGGAAQTVASGKGVDKNWVTVGFKVPSKELAAAFEAVKVPSFLNRTAFIQVQLHRQELLPDGTWGKTTLIRPLPNQLALPLPDTNANLQTQQAYLTWAIGNQKEVLQPGFHDVAQGTPWRAPNPDGPSTQPSLEEQAQMMEPLDPSREYTLEELKKHTPEERRAWQIERQKRKAEERKSRQNTRPRGGPGREGFPGDFPGGPGGFPGGRPPGGGYAPDGPNDRARPPGDWVPGMDGFDPRNPAGRYPGGMQPGMPPGFMPPGYPGYFPGEQFPPGMMPAAAPTVYPCPTGEFEPSAVDAPEWAGWAHDDTVEPGKTYRYMIVYSVKSPVFASGKYAKPPELAKTLGLLSDPEAASWTKEVKIPARTSFYVARGFQDNASSIKFEVFAWQGGIKRTKTFDVAAGDAIGGADGNIDYTTGWTMIDTGKDVRTGMSYVVIADPGGNLIRRDFAGDERNPDYANDKKAAASASAGAAGTTGAPGVPVPPWAGSAYRP